MYHTLTCRDSNPIVKVCCCRFLYRWALSAGPFAPGETSCDSLNEPCAGRRNCDTAGVSILVSITVEVGLSMLPLCSDDGIRAMHRMKHTSAGIADLSLAHTGLTIGRIAAGFTESSRSELTDCTLTD